MVGILCVDQHRGPYIQFVSRLGWFSLAPRYEEVAGDATPLRAPVTNVRAYCTGGPPCPDHYECIRRIQKIQDYDIKERGLPDIVPNFLICADGTVYEGRGWTKESTKSTVDYPEFQGNCVDFAYIGDYRETAMAEYIPSERELNWFRKTMDEDPDLPKGFADNWDDLPFPPQGDEPLPWYAPLVTREEWGALPPLGPGEPLKLPVIYVRWTYLSMEECFNVDECVHFMQRLQRKSMDEGLDDIPYNFIVGGKGIIYEGRGWEREAIREQKYNDFEGMYGKLKGKTLDIAYIGDLKLYEPPNDTKMGACNFIRKSWQDGKIDDMVQFIPYTDRPKNWESDEAFNAYTSPDPSKQGSYDIKSQMMPLPPELAAQVEAYENKNKK